MRRLVGDYERHPFALSKGHVASRAGSEDLTVSGRNSNNLAIAKAVGWVETELDCLGD